MNFLRGPLLIPDSKNMFSSRQYLFTFSGQRYVLQKIIAYECLMQNSIIIVNKGKNFTISLKAYYLKYMMSYCKCRIY